MHRHPRRPLHPHRRQLPRLPSRHPPPWLPRLPPGRPYRRNTNARGGTTRPAGATAILTDDSHRIGLTGIADRATNLQGLDAATTGETGPMHAMIAAMVVATNLRGTAAEKTAEAAATHGTTATVAATTNLQGTTAKKIAEAAPTHGTTALVATATDSAGTLLQMSGSIARLGKDGGSTAVLKEIPWSIWTGR